MYSIELIDTNGNIQYLSVKGKTEWKTKRTAIKHARDIANTKAFKGYHIEVQNEFNEQIKLIQD